MPRGQSAGGAGDDFWVPGAAAGGGVRALAARGSTVFCLGHAEVRRRDRLGAAGRGEGRAGGIVGLAAALGGGERGMRGVSTTLGAGGPETGRRRERYSRGARLRRRRYRPE